MVKTDSQFSTKVYSPNSVCGGQNQKELVVSKTPALNIIHQSEKKTEIVVTETKVIYQPISHIYNVQTAKQRFFLGHVFDTTLDPRGLLGGGRIYQWLQSLAIIQLLITSCLVRQVFNKTGRGETGPFL